MIKSNKICSCINETNGLRTTQIGWTSADGILDAEEEAERPQNETGVVEAHEPIELQTCPNPKILISISLRLEFPYEITSFLHLSFHLIDKVTCWRPTILSLAYLFVSNVFHGWRGSTTDLFSETNIMFYVTSTLATCKTSAICRRLWPQATRQKSRIEYF